MSNLRVWFAIIIFACLPLCLHLTDYVCVDEAFFFHDAIRLNQGERLYLDLSQHLEPLNSWLLGAVFHFFPPTMYTARITMLLLTVAVAIGATWFMLSYFRIRPWLACLCGALIPFSQLPFFVYSHHRLSTFFWFPVLFCMLYAVRHRENRWGWITAGFFLLCVLESHIVKGGMVGLAILVWFAFRLFIIERKEWRRPLRELVYLSSGFLLGCAGLAALIASLSSFGAFYQETIVRKFSYSHTFLASYPYFRTSVSHFPYDTLLHSPTLMSIWLQQQIMYAAPPLALILGLFLLWRQHGERERLAEYFLLWLLSLAVWASVLYLAAPYKFTMVIFGMFILLAAGLENLFVCGRKTARVFALLIVFGLAFWGAKNLSATALQCYRRDRPIQSALGPVSFKDKQQHQAVIDLKKYLENIGSNRYVLCYSYDMVIYHICDLKNPTRYPYIHPSIHTDRDVDIAIAEMEQHRVEYMIWGTKQGCRKMDDYIRHNFRKVAEFGQYRVWRKLSAIEEGAQL
jgi:hypothetical protein